MPSSVLTPLADGLDLGLVMRCNQVLDHFELVAGNARKALQLRSNGMFGSIFGPGTQEQSALLAVIDNDRRELLARRNKVLAGVQDFGDLVAAGVAAEQDVSQTAGYANDSSLADVLAKTATQSGQDIASGATLVASTAGRFVLASIPWWAYLLAGGFAIWKFSPRGRKT